MSRLLVRAKQAVADAIDRGKAALPFYQVQQLERDYQALIQQGFEANPPPPETPNTPGPTKQSPPKNLLDRLHHHPGLPHQNWAEKNPGTVARVDGYKPSASRLPSDECCYVKPPAMQFI
jgi:hypothetical protein